MSLHRDCKSAPSETESAAFDRSEITSSAIWVTIPANNNEGTLNDVIASLENYGYSIVVVDDGSRRPVASYLRSRRIHLCRHIVNLGQGAALQTGIDYALLRGAEYIVTFDADGQHCAEDIPRLIEAIAAGQCDVALGSRFMPGGRAENIPKSKMITLRCAILFTRLLVGLPLTDTHNGLRALTAEAARRIRISQNRMSHATQILQEIAAQRLHYKEVPVTIRYTDYSIRKGQSISNAFNILWESAIEVFQ
jgi:glycosyltransferase involved in cell wall biosynthesis